MADAEDGRFAAGQVPLPQWHEFAHWYLTQAPHAVQRILTVACCPAIPSNKIRRGFVDGVRMPRVMRLEPGDVIMTGAPPGVGPVQEAACRAARAGAGPRDRPVPEDRPRTEARQRGRTH
ncbi:hypothetical protein ETD96_00685 [Actinomadura geliboluensis]|uniref:Fumarylacetoacetase-like C-terminal domain-containing protein n=1 Tax=Actinomadura geliboluensis TaxID=882440 RepID=A0A5S4HBM8_9ACTN|nr:hypothetical protein ETD96_00685 [Actinomadura geliboluensis]